MDLAAAALCIGLASLMRFSSSSKKMTCEFLRRAIPVNDLKGLGECLENIKNPTVVVHGTVGSTSTVENSRFGVFVEERASLDLKKMNLFVSAVPEYSSSTIIEETASLDLKRMNLFVSAVQDSSSTIIEKTDSVEFKKVNLFDSAVSDSITIFVRRKEVPWYLDDGTARAYVFDYRHATGFKDTLKTYFSTEPVTTYFKSPVSDEKIKITDIDCNKRSRVLETGTYLTVVGRAMRDKDGAPTIGKTYQLFNGHIQLNKLVTDLESDSESCGNLSFCLTVLGAILLALNIMQTAVERSR